MCQRILFHFLNIQLSHACLLFAAIINILIFVFILQYKVCKIKHGRSERGMSGIGLGGLLLMSGISVYSSGLVAWALDDFYWSIGRYDRILRDKLPR